MGHTKEVQVLAVAVLFAAIALMFSKTFIEGFSEGLPWYTLALVGLSATCSITASILCLDIWCLKPADSHTLKTLVSQYWQLLSLRLKSSYLRGWIERTTSDIKKVNEKSLMKILQENKKSLYGKKYKFSQISSLEDFVQIHPIKTPEDYQPYINNIIQGKEDVLYCEETYYLGTSSGTTGIRKLLPLRRKYIKNFSWFLGEASRVKLLPVCNLQRQAQFQIFTARVKTPKGITIGPASQVVMNIPSYNVVPAAYSQLHDENQSYYVQALFSIREPELQCINAFSADLFYSYFKFMKSVWQKLCDDIERGSIGKHINLPEDLRWELSVQLAPDPGRAHQLREAMDIGTLGLARRIWPNIDFIVLGTSAAFRFCSKLLADNFLQGVNIVPFAHVSTEGFGGLNLDDEPNSGVHTLIPDPCFIEFIPLEEIEKENPRTVFPEELVKGSSYEMVYTTENGIYRCRTGDIIRVVGFYNKAPRYELIYRTGQRLNIAYERTPEKVLLEAVQSCEGDMPSGSRLINFTTTESTTIEAFTGYMSKGHYVYFIELDTNTWTDMKATASQIENSLIELCESYQRYKKFGSIGPTEIIQVQMGTFEGLKSFIWKAPHSQFKTPRVVRLDSAIKYLLSKAVIKESSMDEK